MSINNKHFSSVLKVFRLQIAIGVIVFLLITFVKYNINSSVSALLGLLCALLPTIIYIRVAFVKQILSAENVLKLHKRAMVFKFISNLILFVLVFLFYKKCDAVALFVAYIFTISGYWFGLFNRAESS